MPKITWLGDDPCVWNEVTFPPGVPLEIDDAYMIGKARNNPFFRLEEDAAQLGPAKPEMWTETAPEDYPEPPKRTRGRPPKVRANVDQ